MSKRKAEGRLIEFLERKGQSKNHLPLVHTTTTYSFADLCDGDKLTPQHCRHFNEDLLYLFYGRPAYRTEDAEFTDLSFNWPIIFVLDPSKIESIEAVYPFDTGAFFLELYSRFFSKQSQIEDFRLPANLDAADAVVDAFYRSGKEYLRGRSSKNVEIGISDHEAQGILKLAQEPSHTARLSTDQLTRDERSSSIEVQTKSEIDIREATLAIILPQAYLREQAVVDALVRWDLSRERVRYYEVMPYDAGGASIVGQLYRIVEDVYLSLGLIEE